MPDVTLDHFKRSTVDVGAYGDNDTLPFDLDTRFVKDKADALAEVAFEFFEEIDQKPLQEVSEAINALQVFSERLLVPTGSTGFRITTKIHPFWNVYLNGIGVAIAERHEPKRSDRAHSYRYAEKGNGLFDRDFSWRAYREATLADKALEFTGAVVVQTDVSSFYEHIYHHRLQNFIDDLFPAPSTVSLQVDRLLRKLTAGRSFGLPVGGQCARALAEVMMSAIDQRLTDEGISWHRYVDDFTLITESQEAAYDALAVLSHALADYGLSLNRTKTTILKANHYRDYVGTQLGPANDEADLLRQIDLHFDPYSDSAIDQYGELKEVVQSIDIQSLLNLELKKAQPDTFLVAQISRTLKFHSPQIAIHLCSTLLAPRNLNAFRASWATIMRGVAAVRADEENAVIFDQLDTDLDKVPMHSGHLLRPEANLLHFLKTIRFCRTDARAQFVWQAYQRTASETVRRGCVECWWQWRDRPSFIRLGNIWQTLGAQEQRMVWLAAADFGDDGRHFRQRVRRSLNQSWGLDIERDERPSFAGLYRDWSQENDL